MPIWSRLYWVALEHAMGCFEVLGVLMMVVLMVHEPSLHQPWQVWMHLPQSSIQWF